MKNLSFYNRIFLQLLGPRIYIAFALQVVSGFTEVFGILLIIPIFSEFGDYKTSLAVESKSYSIRFVSSLLNTNSYSLLLVGLILIILTLFLMKSIFYLFAQSYGASLKASLQKDLRQKYYIEILSADYEYSMQHGLGKTSNTFNEQIPKSIEAFHHFNQFGFKCVNAFSYILIGFLASPVFSLFAIVAAVLFIVLTKSVSARINKLSKSISSKSLSLSKWFSISYSNYKYIVSTQNVNLFRLPFDKYNSLISKDEASAGFWLALKKSMAEPVFISIILAVLYINLVILKSSSTSLIISIILFYRGINSLVGTQTSWNNLLLFSGFLENVSNELNLLSLNSRENTSRFQSVENIEDIVFSKVSYSYPLTGDQLVLDNLSFTLKRNTISAFVGSSGSGKTTIVDILTGILKPKSGFVYINNGKADLSSIDLAKWRSSIGYVDQRSNLFDDTIAANIALENIDLGSFDPSLHDKLCSVLKACNIYDFVKSLPNGYMTKVGDNGSLLSGGQIQRILIAREVFKNPKILILDEATSAIDSLSERAVIDTLSCLKASMTIIVIAHKLASLRYSDQILFVNNGKISESGSFAELSQDPNSNFSLYLKACIN